MPMIRCPANRHFFDSNVHASCPYCTIAFEVPSTLSGFEQSTELANHADSFNDVSNFSRNTNNLKTQAINEIPHHIQVDNANHAGTHRMYDNEPTVKIAMSEPVSIPSSISDNKKMATPPKTQVFGFGSSDVGNNTQVTHLPVAGWLVIVEGSGQGKDFRLIQGENKIGRDVEMEICLDFGADSDEMISRDSHAIVFYDNHANVFFVEKGKSRNMPLINNRTIRASEDVQSGDIIQVGKTKLMLITFCNENFKWHVE